MESFLRGTVGGYMMIGPKGGLYIDVRLYSMGTAVYRTKSCPALDRNRQDDYTTTHPHVYHK